MEVSPAILKGDAMWAVPESIWKQRFSSRLAQLFMQRGLHFTPALADAEAHADESYPHRGSVTPEQEADRVYCLLEVDNF